LLFFSTKVYCDINIISPTYNQIIYDSNVLINYNIISNDSINHDSINYINNLNIKTETQLLNNNGNVLATYNIYDNEIKFYIYMIIKNNKNNNFTIKITEFNNYDKNVYIIPIQLNNKEIKKDLTLSKTKYKAPTINWNTKITKSTISTLKYKAPTIRWQTNF
jgi:hypothetical protein